MWRIKQFWILSAEYVILPFQGLWACKDAGTTYQSRTPLSTTQRGKSLVHGKHIVFILRRHRCQMTKSYWCYSKWYDPIRSLSLRRRDVYCHNPSSEQSSNLTGGMCSGPGNRRKSVTHRRSWDKETYRAQNVCPQLIRSNYRDLIYLISRCFLAWPPD